MKTVIRLVGWLVGCWVFYFSLFSLVKQFKLKRFSLVLVLWGHILPYPKDGLVQPKHIRRAKLTRRRQLLVSYETFDRQTASRERLVLLLYDFLFSVNTITFTYHPLFELSFHRSYLKTTTISIVFVYTQLNVRAVLNSNN